MIVIAINKNVFFNVIKRLKVFTIIINIINFVILKKLIFFIFLIHYYFFRIKKQFDPIYSYLIYQIH